MHNRFFFALGAAATAVVSGSAAAQDVRVYSTPQPSGAFAYSMRGNENRAVIGVSTSTGSARDTLGVLISFVTPGGPAERAGLEEGNRLAAVNTVNLKLAAADVGDWDMANAMSRRLTRELGKLAPGDDVELRVYSGGQTRTVRVKTVAADSLYRPARSVRSDGSDRAAIGVSLGSTGSVRDTLGVVIIGLDDDGPAAKAGLEEGNRIAAVNGVDLRVSRDDAGDGILASARARRLQRELDKLKPGDEVALRVYVGGGRTRDVRVKTVALSDLPRRRTTIFGMPGVAPRAPMAPFPPVDFELRRDLREEMERAGRVIERIAPRIQQRLSGTVSM